MEVLSSIQTLRILCQATGKWGLLVNLQEPIQNHTYLDTLKCIPWLNLNEHRQVIAEGTAIVLCDTKAEMENLYDQVVGDDGPTRLNKYNGCYRAYAITCNPTGLTLDENT